MRIRIRAKVADLTAEHAWWAWYPVVAKDNNGNFYIVWREHVRRQLSGTNDYFFYEYKVW